MAIKRQKFFYRRRFLNLRRHQAGAHVIAKVSMESGVRRDDGKPWSQVDAELTIADCSRTVTLDFDIWPNSRKADRANVLYKARTLREVVNGFVDALEEAAEQAKDK